MTTQDDVNLTAIMRDQGIRKIERYLDGHRFSVVLDDGRIGVGASVAEALENVK